MTEYLPELIAQLKKLNNNLQGQSQPKNKYLSIEQVADMMHCHVNTVRTWIKDGELIPFQYKSTMRVREESLERFVKKHTC